MLIINEFNLLNDAIYKRIQKINLDIKNGNHVYINTSTLLKELEKRVIEINVVYKKFKHYQYAELKIWKTRRDHEILIIEKIPF